MLGKEVPPFLRGAFIERVLLMKRSEINAIMKQGTAFMEHMNFKLPPFAFWTPEEWRGKGPECREIVEQMLGWDITDFGSGDFAKVGLFLFTIRNGTLAELNKEFGKIYAEKIMLVREEQITPLHFHFQKMEDIINRGGGDLVIQFWNSTPDEKTASTAVELSIDGVRRTLPAGGGLSLSPGESVCIPPRLYHKFFGKKGRGMVLVGEVSRVNDDRVDNRFHDPVGRFPAVIEDEPPLYLLGNEYGKYYAHGLAKS